MTVSRVQPDGRILVGMQRNQERRPHQWIASSACSPTVRWTARGSTGTELFKVTLPDDVGFASLAGGAGPHGRQDPAGGQRPRVVPLRRPAPAERSGGPQLRRRGKGPGRACPVGWPRLGRGGPAMRAATCVTIGTTGRPNRAAICSSRRFRQDMTPDTSFGFRGTTIVDVGQRGGRRTCHEAAPRRSGSSSAGRADAGPRVEGSGRCSSAWTVDGGTSTRPSATAGSCASTPARGLGATTLCQESISCPTVERIVFAGHYVVSDLDARPPVRQGAPAVSWSCSAPGRHARPLRSVGRRRSRVFFGEGLLSEYVHVGVRPGDKLLGLRRRCGGVQLLAAVPGPRRCESRSAPGPRPGGSRTGGLPRRHHQPRGASSDGGIVRLPHVEEEVAVVGSTSLRATVDPNMIDVSGQGSSHRVRAAPPASSCGPPSPGYEEGISLAGSSAHHPLGR